MTASWMTVSTRSLGRAGLVAIGASTGSFLLLGLLGPSAVQPGLPGPDGPPFSLTVHPSAYLVIGVMAAGIILGGLGMGLCLYAMRHGWSVSAKKLLIAGLIATAAFALTPPVGSGDHLNYAGYGRMVMTGHDPYATGARDLAGDHIADAVEPPWREEPSVYGPIVTAQQVFASWIGGTSTRLTVLMLSLTNALAFSSIALMLYRFGSGESRLRSVLLWSFNPLLLFHLVSGAHNDTIGIAAAVAALIVFTTRSADDALPSLPRIFVAGMLTGAAVAIKLPAALVGAGPCWAIISSWKIQRERDGKRISVLLARLAALFGGAGIVAILAYGASGPHALDQVLRASSSVSLATPWHLISGHGGGLLGFTAPRSVVQVCALALMIGLIWPLFRALPSHQTNTSLIGAAALVLAWLFAAPYALPWYDGLAWAVLALLPWSQFDWILLIRTVTLSLAYLPARDPQVTKLPTHLSWLFTSVRSTIAPLALTVVLLALIWTSFRRRRGTHGVSGTRTGRADRPLPS